MMTLFENCAIYTNTDVGFLKEGYVLVEGNRIISVGPGACLLPLVDDAEKINAKNRMLVPGLVNAHSHIPMTLIRNYADDMDLNKWLFEHIFPIEDKLTAPDVWAGTRIGLLEMIATGTTAFNDMYYFCDETAKAVEEAGVRCLITRGLMGDCAAADIRSDARVQENLKHFSEWHGKANGRIRTGLAPHAMYTCSPSYLQGIAELGRETGMKIHIHVDETAFEHAQSLEKYGKTPVQHLLDLGLFDSSVIAAHCVHVTDADLALMADKGVTLVHNPSSNLKLASGIAPVMKALAAGVNVALGTDGAASNNTLDMWKELMLTALIHKGVSLNPLAIPADAAFTMATRNGAIALGWPDAGVIESGALADILLIDMDKPHQLPLHNPISALAYSTKGSDVCLTMVDGKILYKDGVYRTIDAEKVRYEVAASVKRVYG